MLYNNHRYINEFEERVASYTGSPYCVAVNSCTNAIVLSLLVQDTIENPIVVPRHTYLSVPMTLKQYNFDISFDEYLWTEKYHLGNNVWDCAVGFKQNMYVKGHIQCLSFGFNKRLPIGRGGAILLDDINLANKLRRLRHDGRDSSIPVIDDDPMSICLGHHMQMIPDEAVKGSLLFNTMEEYKPGGWADYPDISKLRCFK